MLYPRYLNKDGKPLESPTSAGGIVSGATPILFDGKTDRKLALDGYANLSTFTIDLRLISAELPKEVQPYSETSPAMPFIVGANIVCRTEPSGFLVVLREADKDIAKAGVSALFGSTRITIVSTQEESSIFGDGVELVRIDRPVLLNGPARLGAGHLKRFWAGEMEYFDVFDHAKIARTTFNALTPRLNPEGRIATLSE
jgi:hypothetical protein